MTTTKYPLLEEILAIKDLRLQPTYTIRNIAVIFGVTPGRSRTALPPGSSSHVTFPDGPGS